MRKAILITAILFATEAVAGEIVFRSPTSGTLAAIAHPAPTQPEPEQPSLNLHYERVSVAAGTSVSIKPVGDISGCTFSLDRSLPPGLMFDPPTGRIVGVAAVTGNHSITVRAVKDGFHADLVLSLTVS